MRDIDQIAYEWISACGLNPEPVQRVLLRGSSAETLADDAIEGWGLDQPDGYDGDTTVTWLGQRGADRSDLVAAFQRLKNALATVSRRNIRLVS
jgi:hypothetical protein